jgi:hypothetical protein
VGATPRWALLAGWLAALACALSSPALAAEERLALVGAPASVRAPDGEWERQTDVPAAGQWRATFRRPAHGTILEARVFPVKGSVDPAAVLLQAVDLLSEGLGAGGFGLPSRRSFGLDGRPAAEGSISAVASGVRLAGSARIVLASDHAWAFAWGVTRADGPVAEMDAVKAFARSLLPSEPGFYDPTFRERELDLPVLAPEGEEPVTQGHLVAVEGLVEAAASLRFPLAARPDLRDAFLRDARTGTANTRRGYRECALAVAKAAAEDPAARAASMAALGKEIVAAILTRSSEGHEPAQDVLRVLERQKSIVVGTEADGLAEHAAEAYLESAAFLASLVRDGPVSPSLETRRDRLAGLSARWATLAPEEKASFRRMSAEWPALRHAWDTATSDAKFRFRRAVAARLVPASESDRVQRLATARDLKSWIETSEPLRAPDRLFGAAASLDSSERFSLLRVLGVEDGGYRYGW